MKRRDLTKIALSAVGVPALSGLPGIPGPALPHAALAASNAAPAPAPMRQATLPAVAPAEAFGVNEAFRAIHLGSLTGAGWTRWTVQWFNVQPEPGDRNEHYFRDHVG
ncbi:MAG TPA: hypothetical protein VNM48_17415, partial [Chloroflexota bacterium]|nr:hypothetical protein [Chloroflexota bacterium]